MATADPILGFLIDKLYTYLDENYISAYFGFQSEFGTLKDSLPSLKSFFVQLENPKNREVRNDEMVKTTVASLRELIYEADDILEDCQIQADCEKESKPLFSALQRKGFRIRTKKRLEEINGKISRMEEILKTYNLPNMVQQSSLQQAVYNRWSTSIPDEIETVGLVEDVKKIQRWMYARNNELHLVGLVGMGGLGKSTLARKLFHDKGVDARFKKRIWVCVSQDANVVKIMRTILDGLGIKDHGADSIEATLLQRIKEALTGTTYLIIIDDVWSIADGWWNQIFRGLTQEGTHKSCIIITSRKEEVVKSMGVRDSRIHRLNFLSDEDSWSLLCKVAFATSKGICQNSDLEKVGKSITKKCDGLPLAIKAIGGVLSTKSGSLFEWEKILEDFRDKLADITAASEGSSVMASLQLSYDDLPSHLKQCMLCFSIYPEDAQIVTEVLVYWWAGEGFVVPGNNSKTTIQLAYDCLYELFSRCLIETLNFSSTYGGRLDSCKMHDIVRELIIRVAKQEAFCSFDGVEQIFDKDTRRFAITDKSVSKARGTDIANSKIRVMILLLNGSQLSFNESIYHTSLGKVDSLRVLSIGIKDQSKEFEKWVKSQKRLVYLNITTNIGETPKFIKHLRNLQYLRLTVLSVKHLSVSAFQKLRVLELANNLKNCIYPEGLGNLSNLEELSGIELASERGGACRLEELIRLHKLRVLRIRIAVDARNADVLGRELSVLSQLGDLQVLSINAHFHVDEIMKQLGHFTPPPSLKEFYIEGIWGENLPAFIKPELFPELRYLSIRDAPHMTCMSPSFWGTQVKRWNIEALSLTKLPKLQLKWETVRQRMPSISYVEVKNLGKFESFPSKLLGLKFSIWKKTEEEDSIPRDNDVEFESIGKKIKVYFARFFWPFRS